MRERFSLEVGALVRKVGSRYVWRVERILEMGRQKLVTLHRTDDPLTRMSLSPQALADRRMFLPVARGPEHGG